jgi:hypothetical protein
VPCQNSFIGADLAFRAMGAQKYDSGVTCVSCPARKWDSSGDLRFFGISGGARVFVDQAAQDGFSEDPFTVEVGNGAVAAAVFAVGDALGNALVRPGRVVVRLVFGQDSADSPPRGSSTRSRSSRRRVPTRRSQIAFNRGAWTAMRTILVPAAWKTASNEELS